jgi:hypothetical protein
MYSVVLYVKNGENPYYKEVLKIQTDKIFGDLNSMLDIGASVGMNESFKDAIGSFVTISGLGGELTLENLVKILTLYENNLKEKFNITDFTYKISLTDTNINAAEPGVAE